MEALELSKSFYINDHHSISSFFSCLHAPAVIRLILHAGDKGDDVLRAVIQDTGIIHADFSQKLFTRLVGINTLRE